MTLPTPSRPLDSAVITLLKQYRRELDGMDSPRLHLSLSVEQPPERLLLNRWYGGPSDTRY